MMIGGDFGSGVWLWWAVGALVSVGWLVLVVALIGLVLRAILRTGDRYQGPPQARGPDPLSILRERFARGEISKEEFEEAKRILGY
ncbi:MAG TPA: SHOCT domain-containing protein [Candidatus Limnocylindrales bacterium]